MKRKLYYLYLRLYKIVYSAIIKLIPLNKKVVLFESNVGRNFSGNPKYIYLEMLRQGLDSQYKLVWVLENKTIEVPGKCLKAKRFGLRHLYFSAIARIWVFDSRQASIFVKRKGNIFIQTWHGTPLKKLAADMHVINMAGDQDLSAYKKSFQRDAGSWDFLISQNQYSTEIFKRAFPFKGELWEEGYPRNDILFNPDKTYIDQIKRKLDIPLDKKIILYAPTWRDNEYYEPGKWRLNLQLDLNELSTNLSNDYVILVKSHYLVQDENLFHEEFLGFVYNFSSEFDIQLLYLVSDILITDYSSVMFDYSILKRPIIFYVYDYHQYKENLRGFYFNLIEEAPGPVVTHSRELITAIKHVKRNEEKYHEKYMNFIQKYNHIDDGYAAERIVNRIKQLS